MANITNYLNKIKTAVYGKDVRGAIHDAIKQVYDDASVNHDNANMEVKMAPGTHNTLNDRLDNVDEIQAQTNAQLSRKVGDGTLASMSDLGQDVKENMTGGSVAVVGIGSVNNTNVNAHQITPDKLTNEIVINVTDLPVIHTNKYVNNRGEFIDLEGWTTYQYIIPNELKAFTFNGDIDMEYNGLIKYDDGTLVKIVNGQYHCHHQATLLINHNPTLSTGVKSITLKFLKDLSHIDATKINLIIKDNFFKNGYVKDGVFTTTERGFANYKINIQDDVKYFGTLSALDGYKGCFYGETDNLIGNITLKGNEITVPPLAKYMLVNISKDDVVWCESIVRNGGNEQSTFNYSHCLQKPYNFNGKSSFWFGDSITEGFTSGSTTTTNGFPKLFSEHVGMSYQNYGIGGALFTSGFNEVQTIVATIKSKELSSDFIFIAGGTNDYGLGVPLSQFKNTVKELCEYLKTNYNGKVIFITPINRVAPSNDEQATLQEYRNIICEQAMLNGYSVVDGSTFNFPVDEGEYQQAVIPDKLHPSELGYVIYKNELATYLC